ncbi:M14 family metallopeptidase [Zobellia galactanivorans]|uniref:M14 family metallopeptidase n=1 Tax=Zobellia galactanivorans (strain DSM 12802 / CCUG 47099 / CIP 106680 / NCIMB 13871 / Dsij) TaxID=63186 RepID=UPI002090CBE2|nr:M14 family metallopeptidase [Zobellia galactanivorans]MDO6809579.1 M14 family metallopeptidase [Zobellia galactanivorans]
MRQRFTKISSGIFNLLVLTLLFCSSCESEQDDQTADYKTRFELSKGTETATYLETIDFYIRLAKDFPEINMQTIGSTDSGYPLHIITYNPDGDFNLKKVSSDKTILFINNGIHPGESDGIDATMLLFRDFASGKIPAPKNTVLVTIPIYNIGGALNRNNTTRANQNGPKAYGFRGNTLNYDLNRDFIKADTKNARTFFQIFHTVNPDIFIDNHVSNGADYQYTLTHLFTQHNKLGGELGDYIHNKMMPSLEKSLLEDDWSITPYVNVFNQVPEKGFSQFMDYPRYSTGYTTLWNTFGMMVETHMLKPYKQRVEGTYELMTKMISLAETDAKEIKRLRAEAKHRHKNWTHYPTKWQIDTTKTTVLDFKGYEADTLTSEVTGLTRLKYDRNKPFVKKVNYQNHYISTDSVEIPEAYVLKKGWHKVLTLLDLNKINYNTIQKDTVIAVESYKIDHYKTLDYPYEGHYPHYDTKVKVSVKNIKFQQGDILIPTDQEGIRYIIETLEPEATDSFFNWNFFDSILQQKEGFSPYVFEDEAAELLKQNQVLKDSFLSKKANDPEFNANWYAQLDWLFKRSKHYEEAHLQYPVYRIIKK